MPTYGCRTYFWNVKCVLVLPVFLDSRFTPDAKWLKDEGRLQRRKWTLSSLSLNMGGFSPLLLPVRLMLIQQRAWHKHIGYKPAMSGSNCRRSVWNDLYMVWNSWEPIKVFVYRLNWSQKSFEHADVRSIQVYDRLDVFRVSWSIVTIQ